MSLMVKLYECLMNSEYRQNLSEAVKRARGDRSQRKFAKDLGVSYPAVRSWEEGESLPGLENLELIADILGQSLEEFLMKLRGEAFDPPERVKVAEDLMPIASQLPKAEKVRLAQLLINEIATDSDG